MTTALEHVNDFCTGNHAKTVEQFRAANSEVVRQICNDLNAGERKYKVMFWKNKPLDEKLGNSEILLLKADLSMLKGQKKKSFFGMTETLPIPEEQRGRKDKYIEFKFKRGGSAVTVKAVENKHGEPEVLHSQKVSTLKDTEELNRVVGHYVAALNM